MATTPNAAVAATFTMQNSPGPASRVKASPAASPQTAHVGSAFPLPLAVTVEDSFGNGVAGVPVTYAAPATGATAALPATAPVSDAAGRASVVAVASDEPGNFAVTATARAWARRPASRSPSPAIPPRSR